MNPLRHPRGAFARSEKESTTGTAQVDAAVRLRRDEPTLCLVRGDIGVIRSVWHVPNAYFEVEVRMAGEAFPMRALLSADQIEVIAPPPPATLGESHLDGKG